MGLFKRKKNPKDELSNILNGYELPSFSEVIMRVLALLRDPESSMPEIAQEINYDPALVMAVFKMVNSAAFGLSRQVDDIRQAVTLLGRGRLESIVLMQAVSTTQPTINASWFDSKLFWKTSAKRATLARHLATKLHPATATHAFTAGMLQDMGIPILAATLGNKYSKVLSAIETGNASRIDAEKDVLAFDHQLVGQLMAEEWNLPEHLVTSISGHHDEGKVDAAVGLVSMIRSDDIDTSVQELVTRVGEGYRMENTEMEDMNNTAFDEASAIVLG